MTKEVPAPVIPNVIRNQARIIDLLKWNMATYSARMYEAGLRYLDAWVGKDQEAADMLLPRKEFWAWWKNLYNERDERFVHEWDGLEDAISVEDLRSLYRDLHNPKVLACIIAPPTVVFPADFATIKKEMR